MNRKDVIQIIRTNKDLSGLDLTDIDLSGLDCTKANFTATVLTRTNLSGSDLTGVKMSGVIAFQTNMQKTVLVGADLSNSEFDEAIFVEAEMSNAILSGARLHEVDMSEAVLYRADFTSATIENVTVKKVQWDDTTVVDSDVFYCEACLSIYQGWHICNRKYVSSLESSNANIALTTLLGTLKKCEKCGVEITGETDDHVHDLNYLMALWEKDKTTPLRDIKIYKSPFTLGKSYTGIDMQGSRFAVYGGDPVNISDCDFSSANLKKTNWEWAVADNTIFDNAKLDGARMSFTSIEGASFVNASLRKARINERVWLKDVNMSGADLSGTNMGRASVEGMIVDKETKWDSSTKFPLGAYACSCGRVNVKGEGFVQECVYCGGTDVWIKLISSTKPDFRCPVCNKHDIHAWHTCELHDVELDLEIKFGYQYHGGRLTNVKAEKGTWKNSSIADMSIVDSSFRGINFRSSIIRDSDLSGSKFIECDFNGCRIRDVKLKKVDFSGSSFRNTHIEEGVNFSDCNMVGAELHPDMVGSSIFPRTGYVCAFCYHFVDKKSEEGHHDECLTFMSSEDCKSRIDEIDTELTELNDRYTKLLAKDPEKRRREPTHVMKDLANSIAIDIREKETLLRLLYSRGRQHKTVTRKMAKEEVRKIVSKVCGNDIAVVVEGHKVIFPRTKKAVETVWNNRRELKYRGFHLMFKGHRRGSDIRSNRVYQEYDILVPEEMEVSILR